MKWRKHTDRQLQRLLSDLDAMEGILQGLRDAAGAFRTWIRQLRQATPTHGTDKLLTRLDRIAQRMVQIGDHQSIVRHLINESQADIIEVAQLLSRWARAKAGKTQPTPRPAFPAKTDPRPQGVTYRVTAVQLN
jgi:hypothetical protein